MSWVRTDQCIVQTLVVALAMIMRDEFGSRFPHPGLAEQDHPLQAGFLDGPYKPLGVGVQIGTPRRQLHRGHTGIGERLQELRGEQWIAIMNEVTLAL